MFFDRMKAEEEKTIENLKNGLGITSSAHQRFAEAFGMAASALREQEERSKGCDHCSSEINKGMMLAHGFACCTDCGRRLEEV